MCACVRVCVCVLVRCCFIFTTAVSVKTLHCCETGQVTGAIENVHTTVMKFAETGFDPASKQGQSQIVNPG